MFAASAVDAMLKAIGFARNYSRLTRNRKLPKLALVASMRKLVTAVYNVAEGRRPFVTSRTTGPNEPFSERSW